MDSIRVGGRTYTDPDVISLIRATGGLIDPRTAVINQAQELLSSLRQFDGLSYENSIERLSHMASLVGLKLAPMDLEHQQREKRDAVLVTNLAGQRFILFNPNRPRGRVAFSIAHEITHTFFPNSIKGARFRNAHLSDSKEANELERLCDLGAAELLMPADEFRAATLGEYSLHGVERLSGIFGSSYEATVFRLASAHPGIAVAGLLHYRLTKAEEREESQPKQKWLFEKDRARKNEPEPKYRRQSLYLSAACSDGYIIRWNKSFDRESVVYRAGLDSGIYEAAEALPNQMRRNGLLEAVQAPYQRERAHPQYADVLFFWSSET